MARISATFVLLFATLALSGCGMPYGFGNLMNDYGYGSNGYGGGFGYTPGYAGMGLPMPVSIDPGYISGYVQQPYYQGETYQGQTYPYGTYPGQYASNHYRHRHHDLNQQPTDLNVPTTDPTQTGNHPGNNRTYHHRSRTQLSGTGRYGNFNQHTAGIASFQRSQGPFQGPRVAYNQPSGGSPMGQAPRQARTAAPMMSAPRAMAMPRATVGASRPTEAAPRRGPSQ